MSMARPGLAKLSSPRVSLDRSCRSVARFALSVKSWRRQSRVGSPVIARSRWMADQWLTAWSTSLSKLFSLLDLRVLAIAVSTSLPAACAPPASSLTYALSPTLAYARSVDRVVMNPTTAGRVRSLGPARARHSRS